MPDVWECGNQKDIFDVDGKYLKTACAVFTEKAHNKACVSENMSLLVIDSEIIKSQIIDFATSMFGDGKSSRLWIAGKSDMWKAICQTVGSSYKAPFRVDTWLCSDEKFSICEYINTKDRKN